MVRSKAAPYGAMQNGSHGEKEKSTESKAKDKMMETEGAVKKCLDRR